MPKNLEQLEIFAKFVFFQIIFFDIDPTVSYFLDSRWQIMQQWLFSSEKYFDSQKAEIEEVDIEIRYNIRTPRMLLNQVFYFRILTIINLDFAVTNARRVSRIFFQNLR